MEYTSSRNGRSGLDIMSKIIQIDYQDAKASQLLVKSLHETGFAVINNHPIKNKLIDSVYNNLEDFFNSSNKFNYLFHKEIQDGYFPYRSENASGQNKKDLKEFFHIYPGRRYPQEINQDTQKIYDELIVIGSTLLSWMDANTPIKIRKHFSTSLEDMIKDCKRHLLRVIHYPPLKGDERKNEIRAEAHRDINLITVLVAGSSSGLQVLNNNNMWIDVSTDRGSLVINSGDMLQELSDGYYSSTTHRVVNPRNKTKHISRFSMPMFIHPRDEIVLSERYTAGGYLEERLKEIGLKK